MSEIKLSQSEFPAVLVDSGNMEVDLSEQVVGGAGGSRRPYGTCGATRRGALLQRRGVAQPDRGPESHCQGGPAGDPIQSRHPPPWWAEQTGTQVNSSCHFLFRDCRLNASVPVAQLSLTKDAEPSFVDNMALGSGINQVVSDAERQCEPLQLSLQLGLDQLQLPDLALRLKGIVVKIDIEHHEFEVPRGVRHPRILNKPAAFCMEAKIYAHKRLC